MLFSFLKKRDNLISLILFSCGGKEIMRGFNKQNNVKKKVEVNGICIDGYHKTEQKIMIYLMSILQTFNFYELRY